MQRYTPTVLHAEFFYFTTHTPTVPHAEFFYFTTHLRCAHSTLNTLLFWIILVYYTLLRIWRKRLYYQPKSWNTCLGARVAQRAYCTTRWVILFYYTLKYSWLYYTLKYWCHLSRSMCSATTEQGTCVCVCVCVWEREREREREREFLVYHTLNYSRLLHIESLQIILDYHTLDYSAVHTWEHAMRWRRVASSSRSTTFSNTSWVRGFRHIWLVV